MLFCRYIVSCLCDIYGIHSGRDRLRADYTDNRRHTSWSQCSWRQIVNIEVSCRLYNIIHISHSRWRIWYFGDSDIEVIRAASKRSSYITEQINPCLPHTDLLCLLTFFSSHAPGSHWWKRHLSKRTALVERRGAARWRLTPTSF